MENKEPYINVDFECLYCGGKFKTMMPNMAKLTDVKAERARLRAAVEGMKDPRILGGLLNSTKEHRAYLQGKQEGSNETLTAILKLLSEEAES